ncbi:hypothetical protein T265_15851, partial [Opisthorchis viverrini]
MTSSNDISKALIQEHELSQHCYSNAVNFILDLFLHLQQQAAMPFEYVTSLLA